MDWLEALFMIFEGVSSLLKKPDYLTAQFEYRTLIGSEESLQSFQEQQLRANQVTMFLL